MDQEQVPRVQRELALEDEKAYSDYKKYDSVTYCEHNLE